MAGETPVFTLGSGPGAVGFFAVDHNLAEFSFGIGPDGPWRVVTYEVLGTQGAAACDLLKGVGSYAAPPFAYPQPHRYPHNTNLVCTDAHSSLLGAAMPDDQVQTSDYCWITARYEVLSWDAFGDAYEPFYDIGTPVPWTTVDRSTDFEEYEVIDVVAGPDDVKVKRMKRRLPITTYMFSRTMVPDFAAFNTILRGLEGRINLDPFCGAAKGTLFFGAATSHEDRDPSGVRVWTFDIPIRERPYDWNKTLVPGTTNTWEYAHDPGGATVYPYEYASFLPILNYGIL